MRFIKSEAFKWYVILLFIGVVLALILPPSPSSLHMLKIGTGEYHAAILTLILPYALIWLSAFYAYHRLEIYTNILKNTQEGGAFHNIARGATVLALGLAIETILSIILSAIESWRPSFNGTRVLISAYVSLAVPLIAFTFMSAGTRRLTEIVHSRPSATGIRVFAVMMATICAFFTYFVVHDQLNSSAAYKLPLFLVLLTIVIPYVYVWFIGLLAAYELLVYAQRTKGVLYQRAIIFLASGLMVVIVDSIVVQYLNGVFLGKAGVSLGSLLYIIYGLLVIEAFGFALIALGSLKLKQIEDI